MQVETNLKPRVGVIGGGQLANMMAIAAQHLNIDLAVQTPNADDPATLNAKTIILGAIDDFVATADLASFSDVITFENEFVDLDQLQHLAQQGVQFLPQLDSMRLLVDKYTQRSLLQQHFIPVPNFCAVSNQTELNTAGRQIGFPSVLKSRRHGYDGKGTSVVKSPPELLTAWLSMRQSPAILEGYVNFVAELAVIVSRSAFGEVSVYPVVETQQVNQVCHRVIAPARIDAKVALQVQEIAKTIVTKLAVIGVFGIEFFLTADGTVSVNEIAPRTHNSGHYTIEACETSQFEQLLRVVTKMPLGSTNMSSPVAMMLNLLGYESGAINYADKHKYISQLPNTSLHWYGKTESKLGRKLGHVTVLADDYEQASIVIQQAETIWYRF